MHFFRRFLADFLMMFLGTPAEKHSVYTIRQRSLPGPNLDLCK